MAVCLGPDVSSVSTHMKRIPTRADSSLALRTPPALNSIEVSG